MTAALKNTLVAFLCLLVLLTTFAYDQLALLMAQFGTKPVFMPSWIDQTVIPQALLTMQFQGKAFWLTAYALTLLSIAQLCYQLYMGRTSSIPVAYARNVQLYALPLVITAAHFAQENFALYQAIVSKPIFDMYSWTRFNTLDNTSFKIFTCVALVGIGHLVSSNAYRVKLFVARNYVLLPLLSLGAAIYAKAPSLLLVMLAIYTCVNLFKAANYQKVSLDTGSDDIGASLTLSVIVPLFFVFAAPMSYIEVTRNFQERAIVRPISLNGDAVTVTLELRDMNGKPKAIKTTAPSGMFDGTTLKDIESHITAKTQKNAVLKIEHIENSTTKNLMCFCILFIGGFLLACRSNNNML